MDTGIITWLAVGAFVGYLCGQARGREGEGVLLGLLLGPIGWLIVLCIPDKRKKCFECGGAVVAGARRCRHCGSSIVQVSQIRCPACGENGQIPESRMNEDVECPVCKRVFAACNSRV